MNKNDLNKVEEGYYGNKEDYYYYYSDDPNILNMDNDRIFPFIEKLNDNIS